MTGRQKDVAAPHKFESAAKFQPIYSAKVGRNEDLFPDILQLYVPVGSAILDMTYGEGKFLEAGR